MALLFVDGFKHYNQAALPLKWTLVSDDGLSLAAAAHRNGTDQALRMTQASDNITKTLAANYATLIAGVAFVPHSSLGNSITIMKFLDDGVDQITLVTQSGTGKVEVRRGGSGGTLLGTTTVTLTQDVYAYIELKVKIHPSTGTVDLQINGVNVLSLTGQNTRATANSTANQVRLGQSVSNGVPRVYCDFYLCDDSGTYNNTFLGDTKIETLMPSGAGTTTTWVPNTGANYAAVDEIPANGDTDYVASGTPGDIDTYAMANLSTSSGSVKGVQFVINARKDDAGSRTVAPEVRSGSTNYQVGSGHSVGDSYNYFTDIAEVNPNTSNPWLISEVNAAEVGVKLVS